MTQNQQILRPLDSGRTITQIDSYRLYGITRLPARIYDLTRQGHDIRGYMCPVKTRYGTTMVKRYYKTDAHRRKK